MSDIPWVEKYRPSRFDDIVLDKINQSIFSNILEKQYFPNMLFYGPPGTGKTTTIINLINSYYENLGIKKYSSNVIHLNASDERGIDIIRNQIYQFVNSQNIYIKGIKFVILDEVDYMTKNAQQALKYLLQTCFENVRFCLICNYISKIDYSLKNEFLCIRFNQLPSRQIQQFLKNIIESEQIKMEDTDIAKIQNYYQSDIRSMINYIQLNENNHEVNHKNIINNKILQQFHNYLLKTQNINRIIQYIHSLSINYNASKSEIIKIYIQYLLNKPKFVKPELLNILEGFLHSPVIDIENLLLYFACNVRPIINKIESYKEK
jgi:replication factor C subunit 3/5